MSCTPTATEYATITSYSASTFYSTVTSVQSFQTTVTQQSCIASGTIGSSVGCISSTQQVATIATTGYYYDQVSVTSTVPIVVTTPTKTLYAADCTGGANQESTTSSSLTTNNAFVTTSLLVESTLPSSTVVMESSATLADGSVVQTVVTFVSTLPATQVYEPSMVPTSTASHGSPATIPIIASVLGGFFGLIAIVGSIWWFCRRRRYSWDDIFEKDECRDNYDPTAPVPVRRQRNHSKLDLSAEPKPYQYGLVGHVVPPAGSGSPPGSPRTLETLSHASAAGRHSRNTSISAMPLLQGTPGHASRPSTADTMQFGQIRGEAVHGHASANTRVSNYSVSSSAPLIDVQSNTHSTSSGSRSGHGDGHGSSDGLNRSASLVQVSERRVLQVINDDLPSSPTTPRPNTPKAHAPSGSGNVILHTDGGRVAEGPSSEPPAYSL
ncbi:hypothetical protein J3A83DRAFT_4374195 [Scleroderma citrinum]